MPSSVSHHGMIQSLVGLRFSHRDDPMHPRKWSQCGWRALGQAIRVVCLLVGISVSVTVCQGAEPYFRVDYAPSTVDGELTIGVSYELWVPEGVTTLRGLIVHQHGAGTTASIEGSTAAHDLHWQALARKWDCALLGPSYHVLNEKNDLSPGGSELWFDPRRGSDKAFLKALGDLADKTGH